MKIPLPRLVQAVSVLAPALALLVLAGCWAYVNKAAGKQFQSRPGPFSVTVYPVHVALDEEITHDASLTALIATYLEEEGLALPIPGEREFSYAFRWGSSQSALAKRGAEAFSAQVKADSITTDYALLVEILCNRDETEVRAVTYYLADKSGRIADGALANRDWQAFRSVSPADRLGGLAVIQYLLSECWKPTKP